MRVEEVEDQMTMEGTPHSQLSFSLSPAGWTKVMDKVTLVLRNTVATII